MNERRNGIPMKDRERLKKLLELCRPAVKQTCLPIYDYAGPDTAHVYGRGFVLVDRFKEEGGKLTGDRLVLMRDGSLVIQQRTGSGDAWSAGWLPNRGQAEHALCGHTFAVHLLPSWIEGVLQIYELPKIAQGCTALLEESERSVSRTLEAVRGKKVAVASLVEKEVA